MSVIDLFVLGLLVIVYMLLMLKIKELKEEISYLIQRKEQLEKEVGRTGVELSLLQNKVRKLEEK
jgi:hypothetical protein